jgi:hypothetical protein
MEYWSDGVGETHYSSIPLLQYQFLYDLNQ